MVGQASCVCLQITACSSTLFFIKLLSKGERPADLRVEILDTNTMQFLADGLSCDDQSTQNTCADALYYLAKNGLSTS